MAAHYHSEARRRRVKIERLDIMEYIDQRVGPLPPLPFQAAHPPSSHGPYCP